MISSSNKRIAKNTVMLYFRMLFILIVTLFTSRIVMNVLGVENYGIYNVVGGVVVLFTFLNVALSVSTSRYLTFELGKQNRDQLKKVFSAALTIHVAIAFIVFLLAETVGVWFVFHKLIIPTERMNAVFWVYQFSILYCVIGMTQVPYKALIIAHERMNVFAYVSIIDVLLKLSVAYLLKWITPFDILVFYAFLIFSSSVIVALIYWIYCKRQYEECTYHWQWDKGLYWQLFNFSGWNFLSDFTWMMLTHGSNILLNLFFGPVVNAAQAIALQANAAVSNFVGNFRTAVNPQIIKLYANNEKAKMFSLVFQSGKYSYFILLILILPILLKTNFILKLWLKNVPEYAVVFVRLILIYTLVQVFNSSLLIVLQAVGRVKENALMAFCLVLLFLFPVTYVLFKFGYNPKYLYYMMIIYAFVSSFGIKPYLLYKIAGMKIAAYYQNVIVPVVKVTSISIIVPIIVTMNIGDSFFCVLSVSFVSVISVGLSVLYLGIDKETKIKIYQMLIKSCLELYIKKDTQKCQTKRNTVVKGERCAYEK